MQWTPTGGMVGLGDLEGGNFRSDAYATSADGTFVVGWGSSQQSGEHLEAFRWSEATGMVGLGDLAGGDFFSYAKDVSADGSVVVGVGVDGSDRYYDAFIWDQDRGMRKLADVLADDYGVDLAGWQLAEATGISDDGLTIVGSGFNPDGRTEAWVVHLPEPATACTLSLGAFAMLRRERARASSRRSSETV
jgi:probable HAF family extracellular repeat protein